MDTDLNGFTIEQIQQQLGIILQSADFNASARNRAFLDYVVQGRAFVHNELE